MNHFTDRDIASQFYQSARLLIFITAIISLCVITGWIFHISFLKSLLPNFIPMKPNTAIGFLFGSLAIYLKDRQNQHVTSVSIFTNLIACSIAALGILTLLEYVFATNLLIDQLIIPERPSQAVIFAPGRSSPITAFAFILLGLAIIILNHSTTVMLRQALSITIGLCGILVISSFSYDNHTTSPIITYTSASIYTALCLLCMSLALLFIRPNDGIMKLMTSQSEGGVAARTLIPFMIITPIILGQLRALGETAHLYDAITGHALYTIAIIIVMLLVSGFLSSWLMKIATIRNQFEIALQRSEEQFHRALDMAPIGMAIIALDGKYLEVNHALCRLTGYTKDELLSLSYQDITHPDDITNDRLSVEQLINGKINLYHTEKRYLRKDGGMIWVQITASILADKQTNSPLHFIVQIEDITLRKQSEAAIRNLAYHDTLTNLPNRRLLLDRINHAISIAKRYHYIMAILFIDLDKFKEVNDTLGHEIGDELLKAFSIRIIKQLREEDTVARISGDEFIVLLNNIKTVNDAQIVSQKIIDMIKDPFYIDGNEISIRLSIGISIYSQDGDDSTVLIKNADMAMYAAKRSGGNQYRLYSEI